MDSNHQGRAYLEIGETVANRAPAPASCCVYQFRHSRYWLGSGAQALGDPVTFLRC